MPDDGDDANPLILFALLLALAGILACAASVFGAPVPAHLMRPAPDPIVPGYVWYFCGCELQVVAVDGENVTYRCRDDPDRTWPGLDGLGPNQQSKATVRREVALYGAPGPWWPPRWLGGE